MYKFNFWLNIPSGDVELLLKDEWNFTLALLWFDFRDFIESLFLISFGVGVIPFGVILFFPEYSGVNSFFITIL